MNDNFYDRPEPSWWADKSRGDYAHIGWADRRRCHGRGHPRRGLGVIIQIDGVRQVVDHCLDCGEKLSTGIKRDPAINLEQLPTVKDNTVYEGLGCRDHHPEHCRVIGADGGTRVVVACVACGQRSSAAPPPPSTPNGTLPVIRDHRFDEQGYIVEPPCEHCGSHDGVQRHHWAPKALFHDPDRWPTAYLCVPCHTLWHQMATPHITRRKTT